MRNWLLTYCCRASSLFRFGLRRPMLIKVTKHFVLSRVSFSMVFWVGVMVLVFAANTPHR